MTDDISQLQAALRAGGVRSAVAFEAADTIGTLAARLARALNLLSECDMLDDEMEARALGRVEDLHEKRVDLYMVRVRALRKVCRR